MMSTDPETVSESDDPIVRRVRGNDVLRLLSTGDARSWSLRKQGDASSSRRITCLRSVPKIPPAGGPPNSQRRFRTSARARSASAVR